MHPSCAVSYACVLIQHLTLANANSTTRAEDSWTPSALVCLSVKVVKGGRKGREMLLFLSEEEASGRIFSLLPSSWWVNEVIKLGNLLGRRRWNTSSSGLSTLKGGCFPGFQVGLLSHPYLEMPGIEPRSFHMQSRCSGTALQPFP